MKKKIGLVLGSFLFILLLFLPAPQTLSTGGWHTIAIAVLMAVWWITEAVPIAVTALLPIVLFPVFDVVGIGDATAPYANPTIYLFMGGFVLALAMQRWNLHKRIAINILNVLGVKPSSIIMGFIIASAFISMWVSNTATALMMLPIGISILELADRAGKKVRNFELALVLSIAYGCSIGGMGTIIGSPPNALFAGFMDSNYGMEIAFADWMKVGIPLVLIALPLLYVLLTKVVYPIKMKELPGGQRLIDEQLKELGKMSNPEKKVAVVFVVTALLWILRPLLSTVIPGLSDAGIAIAAAVALFLIPVKEEGQKSLLKWSDTKSLPWGILVLFGGGLSLANAISETGLADWIGQGVVSLHSLPIVLLIAIALVAILMVTELMSNTAATATFLPIVASVAIGLGQNPLLMAVPITFAASCAFVLPVSTPPNAIVYGTGRISVPEMVKAGIWLDILMLFVLLAATFTLITYVFGIQLGVLPSWAQ